MQWIPNWEKPTIQIVNDSISYVFYPLLGKVQVNGKSETAKQIQGKMYLMVKNEKDNLLTKYGIAASERDTFYLTNLTNVPTSQKLPVNCPN